MIFDWYKLFSLSDFLATGLVSRTLLLQLESRGTEIFEIFRGNEVSIGYADVFLPINFLENNPYVRDSYAVYKDANDDIWFGFEAT